MTFMSQQDIISPDIEWVPSKLSLSNLKVATVVLDLPKTFFTSAWYTTTLALAQTIVSALTGYAFARFNFKFKNMWFIFVLMSYVIPMQIVMIPRVMMFITLQDVTGIKMIGSILPQLSMTFLGQGIYSAILILIFFNFFKLIPIDLDEAAAIDGANAWQTFYHIILKVSAPTILTVFLFSFVWNWNETYITSTFVRGSIELLPMQLGQFDSLFASRAPSGQGEARINEAYKMAATLISILPLIIMYFFVQRKFIEGIESTGITGQ
jgi:multiple sugar transport system permease protein